MTRSSLRQRFAAGWACLRKLGAWLARIPLRLVRFAASNSAVQWSGLRRLGQSPLARATVVVPVVGYVLIMNPLVVDLFNSASLSHGAHAAAHQPVAAAGVGSMLGTPAWRLVFLYYGLTLIGLATALFGWLCPLPIKKYQDGIDYAIGILPFFRSEAQWKILLSTLRTLDQRKWFVKLGCSQTFADSLLMFMQTVASEKKNGRPAHGAAGLGDTFVSSDPLVMHGLKTQYAMSDFEGPVVRCVILLFYAAGVMLIGLSSLWGMLGVTAAVFGFELPIAPWTL